MRGLTLRQPYAAALALGLKRFETRSWSTTYRGLVAIHAARGEAWPCDECIDDALREVRGAILGIGRLVDVQPTERLQVDEREMRLGNYALGRYAWVFQEMSAFQHAVPCGGRLGLWRVSPAIEAALFARL